MSIYHVQNDEAHKFIPAVQAAMEAMASKSIELLNKGKDELEENYKMSVLVVDQTRSAVNVAEQAAENYISAGAIWLSSVLDKASKCVSAFGARKRDNPNSRKQK